MVKAIPICVVDEKVVAVAVVVPLKVATVLVLPAVFLKAFEVRPLALVTVTLKLLPYVLNAPG